MDTSRKLKEKMNRDFAWHYTTGQNFVQIVKSGVLLPTAAYIARRERPVIWFSLEQFWEPTAQKRLQGRPEELGMQGTYEHGGGLVRFGVAPAHLVPWPRLARLARIPSAVQRGLVQSGRAQGATPERWLGMIGRPMSLMDIEAIDVFDGQSWTRIKGADENNESVLGQDACPDSGCQIVIPPQISLAGPNSCSESEARPGFFPHTNIYSNPLLAYGHLKLLNCR